MPPTLTSMATNGNISVRVGMSIVVMKEGGGEQILELANAKQQKKKLDTNTAFSCLNTH